MFTKVRASNSNNRFRPLLILACMMFPASVSFAHEEGEESGARTPPDPIFSTLLSDFPGKRLTVVELNFPPRQSARPSAPRSGHRHPGPVYIYVTKGSVRWALEGEPVKLLHTGDSYFEPTGVLHTLAENASTSEPASVIAVMILPDGAPLLTID